MRKPSLIEVNRPNMVGQSFSHRNCCRKWYRNSHRTPTNTTATFGKKFFDQWYRDVPGTNVPLAYPLIVTLTSDGQYEYDSEKSGVLETAPMGGMRRVFAPIDDGTPYETVYGNQGGPHNFNFTGEIHTVFTHLFQQGDTFIDTDVVYGVKAPLVVEFVKRPAGKAPNGETVDVPFYEVKYDFVLERKQAALQAAE